jgi:type I restriction enzyme S subunit
MHPVRLPYLRVANVQAGALDLHEIKEIDIGQAQIARYSLQAGDVLMTEGGDFDKLGRGAIWTGEIDPCLHQNHVFAVRCDKEKVLPEWISWVAGSQYGRRYFALCSKQSTNLASINSTQLRTFPLPLPSLTQQRTMAGAIRAAETLLTTLSQYIDAKRVFKRGLMQQLLSGNRRFPEFLGVPRELRCFDSLCEELSDRNGSLLGRDAVMGVIKGVGLVAMRNRVRGKGDLKRYKVLPPDAFAFNPMRLNIGSIAHNNLGRPVLVSPDYEVFRARQGTAIPGYINQLRYSSYWNGFMKRAGAGSVRVRIYFSDLARLSVPAPKVDEQLRIETTLNLLGSEIELLSNLRKECDNYKGALLSRLLSGDIVVPA